MQTDTPGAGKDTYTVAERGFAETDAAAHNAGARVWVNPQFSRVLLRNALKAIIQSLYPMGVYNRAIDATLTFRFGTQALPTGTKDVVRVRVSELSSGEHWSQPLKRGIDYDVLFDFTSPRIQLYQGGATGRALQLTLAKDFDVSAFTDATDLDGIGVPSSLQPNLALAVAAYVLQGEDISRLMLDDIRSAFASLQPEIQVGTSFGLGQSMMQLFESRYIVAERQRLKMMDPPSRQYVA